MDLEKGQWKLSLRNKKKNGGKVSLSPGDTVSSQMKTHVVGLLGEEAGLGGYLKKPESRGHCQFSDEDARCGAPRRRGGAGGVFEETEAENIPDLWKDMSPGSSVDSNKINSKRPTSRLTIIRFSEAKDKG